MPISTTASPCLRPGPSRLPWRRCRHRGLPRATPNGCHRDPARPWFARLQRQRAHALVREARCSPSAMHSTASPNGLRGAGHGRLPCVTFKLGPRCAHVPPARGLRHPALSAAHKLVITPSASRARHDEHTFPRTIRAGPCSMPAQRRRQHPVFLELSTPRRRRSIRAGGSGIHLGRFHPKTRAVQTALPFALTQLRQRCSRTSRPQRRPHREAAPGRSMNAPPNPKRPSSTLKNRVEAEMVPTNGHHDPIFLERYNDPRGVTNAAHRQRGVDASNFGAPPPSTACPAHDGTFCFLLCRPGDDQFGQMLHRWLHGSEHGPQLPGSVIATGACAGHAAGQ